MFKSESNSNCILKTLVKFPSFFHSTDTFGIKSVKLLMNSRNDDLAFCFNSVIGIF